MRLYQCCGLLQRQLLPIAASLACSVSCCLVVTAVQAKPLIDPPATPQLQQLEVKLDQLRADVTQADIVDLPQAVAAVLNRNPALARALSEVEARRWDLVAVRRSWMPSLSLSTDGDSPLVGQLFNTSTAVYPNSTGSSFATSTYNSTYYQYSSYPLASVQAVLNWEFYKPTRGPRINASLDQLQAQRLAVSAVARSLILDAQIAYNKLQEIGLLIDDYEKICAANRLDYALVVTQLSKGLATVGDRAQQLTLLLNQVSTLLNLYNAKVQAAADLARLMGVEPGTLVVAKPLLPLDLDAPMPVWSLGFEATLQQGLKLREEIQMALKQASAERWQARRWVNQYLPALSLKAYADYANFTGYYQADVGSSATPYYSNQTSIDAVLGLGLHWTLFDGGVRRARARSADASAASYGQQATAAEQQIGAQIRSSFTSFEVSAIALPAADLAWKQAQSSLAVARKRYAVGIGDLTTVVQANEMLARAAENVSQHRLAYKNSVAELYRYSAEWPPVAQQGLTQLLASLRQEL